MITFKDRQEQLQWLKDQRKKRKLEGGVGGHSHKRSKTDIPLPQKSLLRKPTPFPSRPIHPFSTAAIHYANHIHSQGQPTMLPIGTQAHLTPGLKLLQEREKSLIKAIELVTNFIPPKHREIPLKDLEEELTKVKAQIKELT